VSRRPEPLEPTSVVVREITELRAAVTAREAARTPARDPFRWFWRLVVEVIHKADRDRLLGMAAEAAFFAVLTLFPALLAVAAVLGQLGALIGEQNARRVEDSVITFLDRLLTDTASPAIETVRELFDDSGNALTIATLLAVLSLSTAFSALINTVTITTDVPETRGWWRRRWLRLLLVIGPLFGRAEEVVEKVGLGGEYAVLWSFARWPVAFAALVLWATTMDHLAPAMRVKWRYALPGGILTALLWLLASYGLNLYLELVVRSSPIFGALGGGLILMTWFYLLCVALLAGSELNTILLARRRHRAHLKAKRQEACAEELAELQELDAAAEVPPAEQEAPTSVPVLQRRTTG
jgi:membrane protein